MVLHGTENPLLHCFTLAAFRYWQVTEILMPLRFLPRCTRVLVFLLISVFAVSIVQAQGAKQPTPQVQIPDADADHVKERDEWFFRGRLVQGKSSAELRRRAYLSEVAVARAALRRRACSHSRGPRLEHFRTMDATGAHAAGLRCHGQRHAEL